MEACNYCFGEVKWDSQAPAIDCGLSNCDWKSCGANGGMGRHVHQGNDCGHFKYALTKLEREW